MTGKTDSQNIYVFSPLPARPCDADGMFTPPGMLPIPPPPKPNDDWSPFCSRAGFELAELLYKKAELSQSNVDELLNIWAATLAPHGDEPPMSGYRDLHAQIDAIDLGFVPWKSSTVQYQGQRPENSAAPSWMDQDYHLWYRDPRKVIHNILANPGFSGTLDYIPYRDFRGGKRHYCDFMSGDWGWNQCVRNTQQNYTRSSTDYFSRTLLQWTHRCMGLCLFQ
jgi:hypothetical protein